MIKMQKKQSCKPQVKNTVNIVNLFDFDIVQSWRKVPLCGLCNQEYIVSSDHRKLNRPMILDCSHSVCEKCVFQNREYAIVCPECKEKTLIDHGRPIREKVEINYHLFGLTSYIQNQLISDISFVRYKQKEKSPSNNHTKNECSECNTAITNEICVQCNALYCKSCFQKIHKIGKILQKHTLRPITQNKSNTILNEKFYKKCFKHKKFIDHYCFECNKTICLTCSTDDHLSHSAYPIVHQNNATLPKVYSLMETLNMAMEQSKTSQKTAKFVQRTYEDHASETIEQISKYFEKLHASLQIIEKNLLIETKMRAMVPIEKAKKAYEKFKKSQETIEEMHNTLLTLTREKPCHVPFAKVIENIAQNLNRLPCKGVFDGFEKDLFKFNINFSNPQKELENFFQFETKEENTLNFKISTIFEENEYFNNSDDENDEFDDEVNETIDEKESKLCNASANLMRSICSTHECSTYDLNKGNSQMKLEQSVMSASNLSLPLSISNFNQSVISKKVYISYIISPEEFYVQNENFKKTYETFRKTFCTESEVAITPDYIDINSIYLVLNIDDKLWYRGQVLKALETNANTYEVFLIDHGNTIEVPKSRIREISEELKQYSAVVKCSIYGIRPKNEKWTRDASFIMHDIVSNEIVNMIMLKAGDPCLVDIVTFHSKHPTSLRDALLFTDLAEPIKIQDHNINCNISNIEGVKKSLLCLSSMPKFYKNSFHEGENFRVKILNIINPQHFYAAKYDHKDTIVRLQNDLNKHYETKSEKIYGPQVDMPCAVYINENWYRARISKILEKGNCRLWLVDKGNFEIVNWKQLRALDDKFLEQNEYAFQCSLADIEPLQDNYYTWTDKATAELNRITKNPIIHLFIHHSKQFRYKVVLHIIKTQYDINVNALMVKYGHAISTGNESVQVEYSKRLSSTATIIDSIKILKRPSKSDTRTDTNEELKNQKSNNTTIKRRKIKISHIVSPGEFYIHLIDHIPAITRLHEEIQLAQKQQSNEDNGNSSQSKDWKLNDHCLVLTALNNINNRMQWYRGAIVEIENKKDATADPDDDDDGGGNVKTFYKVFLRDHGKVVSNILSDHIAPISSLFNFACNGAVRCHMACVQPTGGLDTWSCSSIDELKSVISKYELLAASLQNKRKGNSLPIILWGLKIESSDPLAPATHKWININKKFVNCGLVHLTEKFNLNNSLLPQEQQQQQQQQDSLNEELTIENEIIENAQTTIVDWLNSFVKGINDIDESTTMINDKTMEISDDDLEKSEILTVVPSIIPKFKNSLMLDDKVIEKSEEVIKLEKWHSVQLIEKSVFTAYPTYVDENAIVYLHDVQREVFLKKIREIINSKVKELKKPSEDTIWYPGQSCLALYHLDNQYYRATVIKMKPDDNDFVIVQFVDYGNIEECHRNDLYNQIIFNTIPIQASKFKIDKIEPMDQKWTTDVLDYIHSKIVGKMCTIRVSPNQDNKIIKKCSIRFECYDLADLLVIEKYAKYSTTRKEDENKDKLDETFLYSEKDKKNQCNASKSNHSTDEDVNDEEFDIRDYKSNNENDDIIAKTMDNEDYKKLFEKLEIKKLCNSTHRRNRNFSDDYDDDDSDDNDKQRMNIDDDDYSIDYDDDVIELEYTYQSDYWQRKCNQYENNNDDNDEYRQQSQCEIINSSDNHVNDGNKFETNKIYPDDDCGSSIKSFNPLEVSSMKNHHNGLKQFPSLKLSPNNKGFYCEVTLIHNPTSLFVLPYLTNNQKQYNDMFRKLQTIANTLPLLDEYDTNTPCLALYTGDNLWYRAIVRTYFPDTEKVDVFYVDFLNAELLSKNHVKTLPKYFLDIPLRNIEIKLYDVKPNQRYRENDILKELVEVINDRKVFAKIIKRVHRSNDDSILPYVILYDSQSEDRIIYEKLIREKFLLRK